MTDEKQAPDAKEPRKPAPEEAPPSKAEKFFDKATRIIKAARSFTIACIALVIAVGTLTSGILYIRKILLEASADRVKIQQTHEQAKTAASTLDANVQKLADQVQQNHDDVAALSKFVEVRTSELVHTEVLLPAPPSVRPRPRLTASVEPPAPPAPTTEPPKVGPKPEPIEQLKVNEVFK